MTPFTPETLVERSFGQSHLASRQSELIGHALSRHIDRIGRVHSERMRAWMDRSTSAVKALQDATAGGGFAELATSYGVDAAQRMVLTLDVLRERGNGDIAHEAAGTPPVLIYRYETVLDGRTLKRPINYQLLRILPPDGIEVHDWKRPYIIIDPRAGHGAGIGGFKEDSQVGVALQDGHPVYFLSFRPHPEPGQTLADVTRGEATFVREVQKRHPDAPHPIIVGNCQGGWATMLLAATNPDIAGPLVINGAPLAYWSGRIGENPMRYNGGLLGGVLPALLLSDLNHGELDGAHLVSNFEMLNPSRNFWGKYYDLYADVDRGRGRFLEFERWWGGYHFMAEAEIRWIVEQLFVGNRLARGEARLEHGRSVDLKQIRSPIIVFASFGDNITPPQQALNWIVDTYADENEIRIRGQRILYMVHDKVGHLGIFVSSSIAKKEHAEMASTLKTIEALGPGLYEMKIETQEGEGKDARFTVSFHERTMADIKGLDDGHRYEEAAFAAVDRLSQLGAEMYELTVRPAVQASVTAKAAEVMRDLNPSRVQRRIFSDRNPAMAAVAAAAERVVAERTPAGPDHPLRVIEQLWSEAFEQSIDLVRDVRDMWYELTFLGIYASPVMSLVGDRFNFQRTRKDPDELRTQPEVLAHLLNINRGGYAEAVIRMLILLANARGSVRRSRLERSSQMLTMTEPFAAMGSDGRAALIHEQSVIVEFERDASIAALAMLLANPLDRLRAIEAVEHVAGPLEEMEPHTIAAIQTFRRTLDLPPIEAIAASAAPALAAGNTDAAA